MRFRLRSGRTVGYAVAGAGDPLMLIHPIGLTRRFWDDVVQVLQKEFLTIAVDLPGHGDSDVTTDEYRIATLAADCAELVAAQLGRATIVGCSMGASVAQLMAADHPETVHALVLANTSGPRTGRRTDALMDRAQRARRGMAVVADDTVSRWFSDGFKAGNPEKVEWIARMLLGGDPTIHARAWEALAARPDDHYGRIRVPTLAIAGTEDPGASPAAVKRLAAAIEGARYAEIAGAGHLSPVEEPEAFASIIRTFVKSGTT